MLRFFHQLRQRLLTDNKFRKYLLYAVGEVFLVMVGILLALQVNNWNEDNKERKLEVKYLKGLRADLEKDLKSLAFMRTYRQTASVTALKFLNAEKIGASSEAQQEFLEDFIKVHFWYEFTPNDNTFKELTSSGNLSILQNESIKLGLLNLESLHDEIKTGRDHMRREYDRYLYDQLVQYEEFALIDFEHLTKEGAYDILFVRDAPAEHLEHLAEDAAIMLANPVIRNGWKLAILNNSFLLELYDRMVDQIDRIQIEIDNSLKNS